MKDFTPTQKLLMAAALFVALTFAVSMGYPADARTQAPAAASQSAAMLTPF